ncbi:MAG: T9SS C-terminal target domain-containing protein [Ignavibacteriae bacterium]|nr:MAG: T9SS C-terminal target domain-containing protein [Ignavibacteriota bacterium]
MKSLQGLIVFCFVIQIPLDAQTMTGVILPKYIQGNTGANANRIPYVYRSRITGLKAGATYRYYHQIVRSTDADTVNGAGNCIFVAPTGNFIRSSSPTLKKAGDCGTLTADVQGVYEGWFITEPTGNERFTPGRYIFMRIMLNDGDSGTSVAARLTASDSVKVLKLDPSKSDSTGTGLRCSSSASPQDFVFLYDNEEGYDRPVSGSFIESDGSDNSSANNYAVFYANQVNNVSGAFGALLPNNLPNGLRCVIRRSRSTGVITGFVSDDNGTWPSGVNTVNPFGGTSELVLLGTDVQWTTEVRHSTEHPQGYSLFQNFPNPFNPATTILYRLPVKSSVHLEVFDVLGQKMDILVDETQGAGEHSVHFNSKKLSSGIYFYKLTAGTFSRTKQMMLVK